MSHLTSSKYPPSLKGSLLPKSIWDNSVLYLPKPLIDAHHKQLLAGSNWMDIYHSDDRSGIVGLPRFKALSERLEELRDKAEKGLISSIEFVKELCKIAKETVQAEKELGDAGEREVQKSLRQALLKYKLHKDQALFDRAYAYIKEYY